MSRKPTLSQSKSTHSESHSQKLAKAKGSETVGDATKAKSGTLTAEEMTTIILDGAALDTAAHEAKAAKIAAIEAKALASRLALVAKNLSKKDLSRKPSSSGSKRKGEDAQAFFNPYRKTLAEGRVKNFRGRPTAPTHVQVAQFRCASQLRLFSLCVYSVFLPSLS